MSPTNPDPVIDEIREIRHRISAGCDHDPAKLVALLMKYQEQFRDRLTYDPAKQPSAQPAIQGDTGKTMGSRLASPVLNS